jgi:hypothetical protein
MAVAVALKAQVAREGSDQRLELLGQPCKAAKVR